MTVFRTFVVAIALALTMPDAAHAGPIAAAIGAIAGAFGITAATIGSFLLTTALNLGMSLLQKKLAKKNQQRQRESGIVLDIKMGDDQPVSFVMGKYAASGIRKYIGVSPETRSLAEYIKSGGNAFGAFAHLKEDETPNALVTDVIELGWLPSRAGERGIVSLWVNEELCTIDWDKPHQDGRGFPVDKFRDKDGKPHLWVRYLDGTQTQADPYLVSTFSEGDHPFKSSMIGRGCQALILTAKFNRDIFSSLPSVIVEPAPLPLYDLRKDSTNGGNGSHRWGDPTTYEATTNPAVMIYNIIRGIYYEDEWVYGGQNLAAFRLPASNWMAAANECDRLIDVDGKQEPQYRAGISIACDREPLDMIEELAEACNGRLAEVGGIFKLLVGAPGAAVYSFTDDHVVITRGQSFNPFPALSQTHNAIEATYPEPAERWAMKDAPARTDEALEAADGGRRLATGLEFLAVPFANQVQRLMKAVLQDNRRFRTHSICLPPDAFALEPNDVVSWTSARNGYQHKKFLVTRIDGERSFLQAVHLREIDPTDYSWFSRDYLETTTGWLGTIIVPAQLMTGWQVEPATIYDDQGRPRRPAVRISCTPDLSDVARVWVQIRTKSGDVIFDSDSTPYGAPYSWIVNASLPPDTMLAARGKFVPGTTRPTEWSEWLDVKTPNIKFGELDIVLPGTVDVDPPDIPSGLRLTSTLEGGMARVDARWNASGADDLVEYHLEIALNGGNFVSIPTVTNYHTFTCLPGTLVQARIRAIDWKANASGYSKVVEIVAAADAQAPATPVNVTAKAGFESVWITWDKNPEPDMAYYGVEVTAPFAIEAKDGETGPDTPVFEVATRTYEASGTSFAVMGLKSGDEIKARVNATDTSGNSSPWCEPVVVKTVGIKAVDFDAASMHIMQAVEALPMPIVETTPVKVYLTTERQFYVKHQSGDGQWQWLNEHDAALIRGRIGSDQIGLEAVDTANIRVGGVGATNIGMFAISTPKLRSNSVTAKKMRAESVEANHMKAGTIGAREIAAFSIGTNHLSAGAVTARTIGAMEINANHLTADTLITRSSQIGKAIIDDAHIAELSAAKLRAGSVLSSSVYVGGQTIGAIQANAREGARDPAERINSGWTQISPGRISINGSNTLRSWIYGGDDASFNGGAIAANTIDANKMRIGARGISVAGIDFWVNKNANRLHWTAGSIAYVNDNGTPVRVPISEGSVTLSAGRAYVWWTKDATFLSSSGWDDWQIGLGQNAVHMASYGGGAGLQVLYGGTYIDGTRISTRTITGEQVAAEAIRTEHLTVGGVTTDKMAISSASVLSGQTNYWGISIQSYWQTITTASIHMPYDGGAVFVSGASSIGYPKGGVGMQMRLLLNGSTYWISNGSSNHPLVNPSGCFFAPVSAGNYTAALELCALEGSPTAIHGSSCISIIGAKR